MSNPPPPRFDTLGVKPGPRGVRFGPRCQTRASRPFSAGLRSCVCVCVCTHCPASSSAPASLLTRSLISRSKRAPSLYAHARTRRRCTSLHVAEKGEYDLLVPLSFVLLARPPATPPQISLSLRPHQPRHSLPHRQCLLANEVARGAKTTQPATSPTRWAPPGGQDLLGSRGAVADCRPIGTLPTCTAVLFAWFVARPRAQRQAHLQAFT